MKGHWLDIDHTAVHFGVSPKTVRGWIRRNMLPCTAIKGEHIVMEKRLGTWYVDVDSVKFLKPAAEIALTNERKRTKVATNKIEELRKANAELKKQISAVLAEKSELEKALIQAQGQVKKGGGN